MDRSNHTDGALTKTVGATCKVPQCRRFEHDPTSARDQSGCVHKRGGGPEGPSKRHMRRQDIPPALDLVATYSHGWCTVTLMLHFMIKLYHTQWYCTAQPLGCLTTIETSSRPATLSSLWWWLHGNQSSKVASCHNCCSRVLLVIRITCSCGGSVKPALHVFVLVPASICKVQPRT